MRPSHSLFALVALLGATALAGCAADSSPDDAEPSDPSEDALTKSVAFSDEGTLKQVTVEGKSIDFVQATKDLDKDLADMTNAWPGVAFEAYAVRMPAADANALASDPKHLVHVLDMSTGTAPADSASITDITATEISRKDAFAKYTDAMGFGNDNADAKTAFEKSLRVVIKSLLAKPTNHVFEISYCPDWCDEYLVAVTSTGEIRVVVGHGDN